MAELGYEVVAVDNSPAQLRHLTELLRLSPNLPICPVLADARRELPLPRKRFALAVVFHFVSAPLLLGMQELLAPGGRLIFQSYPAHGGNWRQLPRAGQTADLLTPAFELLDYRERKVGPSNTDAVTVSAVGQLRRG
jgi:SAM-dependent methyltransferase